MLSFGLLCVSTAWAWPANNHWVSLSTGAMPITDVTGDQALDHSDALDLAGDTLAPALMWYADASNAYFRLQTAGDPQSGSLYIPGTWGLLIDADADSSTFEFIVAATGVNAQMEAWKPKWTHGGPNGAWRPKMDAWKPKWTRGGLNGRLQAKRLAA